MRRDLRRHRRSHPGIDLADYLIAATAQEAGATLVTLNVTHFPMFSGLRAPMVKPPRPAADGIVVRARLGSGGA